MSSSRRKSPARRQQSSYKPTRLVPAPDPLAEPYQRPTVATINTTARFGRDDIAVGDRVLINSKGLFAGQEARVIAFAEAAVPTARVRVDSGGSRLVRTIDLEPLG